MERREEVIYTIGFKPILNESLRRREPLLSHCKCKLILASSQTLVAKFTHTCINYHQWGVRAGHRRSSDFDSTSCIAIRRTTLIFRERVERWSLGDPRDWQRANGETVSAELATISTLCGMASEEKIRIRSPLGEMTSRGEIKIRSLDVKRKNKKWIGKTEAEKVICRKKVMEAQRVSRSLHSPKQNEAVCVTNKERMRKRRKEQKEEQEKAEHDQLRRKIQSFLLVTATKCSGSNREKGEGRVVCLWHGHLDI